MRLYPSLSLKAPAYNCKQYREVTLIENNKSSHLQFDLMLEMTACLLKERQHENRQDFLSSLSLVMLIGALAFAPTAAQDDMASEFVFAHSGPIRPDGCPFALVRLDPLDAQPVL